MNIQIIHEGTNSIFLLKNVNQTDRIRVRDIIINLMKNSHPKEYIEFFKTNKDIRSPIPSKFSLYDQNEKLEENEYINLNDEKTKSSGEKILYFLENKNFQNEKYHSGNKNLEKDSLEDSLPQKESIEEILMKVTGAKEKLNINRKVKKSRRISDDTFENEFDLFERILQTSQNSLDSIERLNAIRNLLMRPLLSGMNQNSQSISSNQQNNNSSNNQSSSNIINSSNPFYIPRRVNTVQPDPVMINNLKEMGFEEDRIRRALIATSNDMTSATEMLLNGTDLDLEDDLPSGFINYSNGNMNVVQVVNGSNQLVDQEVEANDEDDEIYDDDDLQDEIEELQEGDHDYQDHEHDNEHLIHDPDEDILEYEDENFNYSQNNQNQP
jgi:hypothetical protein